MNRVPLVDLFALAPKLAAVRPPAQLKTSKTYLPAETIPYPGWIESLVAVSYRDHSLTQR
jgi:hypothetical protein